MAGAGEGEMEGTWRGHHMDRSGAAAWMLLATFALPALVGLIEAWRRMRWQGAIGRSFAAVLRRPRVVCVNVGSRRKG